MTEIKIRPEWLRAAGWLDPDEAAKLQAALKNMQANAEVLADEVVHAHAQLAVVQLVIEAARQLRQRLEADGSPFVIDHRYFATTRALAAVVDALDADSPPEGPKQG